MILRPYQLEAEAAIYAELAQPSPEPGLVVLPCGMGKTVIFASVCRTLVGAGWRPLILVNRNELVKQTVRKLWDADPSIPVGVVQAERNEIFGTGIVVASVPTISKPKRLEQIPPGRFNIILSDEAHYSAADSWQRVYAHFPDARMVGFTATPSRSDKRGLGDTWVKVLYQQDIAYGIENGYLSPYEGVRTAISGLDLSKVRRSHGDFVDRALGEALTASHAAEQVAQAYLREASGPDGLPRRGILFAPTVASAAEFVEAFCAAGIPAELVVGDTPQAEREAAYGRVERGVTRVLCSVGVLAVGFNLPCVEVAVMARPTKSKELYVQMGGRVARLSPETGKRAALVMDVVGASSLGLAAFADLKTSEPEAPPADELLDELEEDEPKGPRPPVEKTTIHGSIDLRPIDPLTGAPLGALVGKRADYVSEWLTTPGGVPFLAPTRTFPGLLFATVGLDGARGWYARTGRGTADVVFAAPTLEAVRADLAAMHPGEPLDWGAVAATAPQIRTLREHGVAADRHWSLAEASREISRAKVGKLLDPHFPVGTHRSEVPA